ncbi:cupin domain [Panacagrimonas perspica]|uniref:Cupin domain n=1 Tax=Panacagrimonas perspica TaxID=381431 RepID=A0A4V3URH9_9GAMM|nr:cupin domain-containing protein [Panacagrimonas perspica]TDU31833.1 cupin domain [Panacagrimonas perspica]THD02961.1 hypothetical protein B1810_10165 [Panacagrimonas perspica]
MRRVVTGHDSKGRAVFVSDGEAPRYFANKAGGYGIGILWSTEETASIPVPPGDPSTSLQPYFPAAGGSRFLYVDFLPDSFAQDAARRGVDPVEATREFFEAFPGLGGTMEEDAPGMHASMTIDYGFVVSGQVELELDDGVKKTLGPGDSVIQNGTRHRWYNPGADNCRVVFSVIGARRGR